MKAISPLGLLVLPVAVLLAFPGCRENAEARHDPEWLKLESERVKRAHQVELLKLRMAKVETRGDEFIERTDGLEDEVERRALLVEQAEILKGEVAELSGRVERDRSEWLRARRAAAVGRSFATLEGARGRIFEEVVITRVTDVGIEFRHATGSARLAAVELTSDQQGLFGVDPGMAGEALHEEQAIARAYDSWVDERVAISTARDEAAAAAMAAVASVPTPPVSASAESVTRRLRDEPREVGRRDITWYPSYSRGRYCYYGSGYYRTPSPYVVRNSYPNIRVASSNWSYTPRASACPSPVVTPRGSFSTFTRP